MLSRLPNSEPVIIDLDNLARLQGDPSRQGTGWAPVDGLIAALCEAEVAWADARMPVLRDLVTGISTDAGDLGMKTFSSVASQTAALADGRDPVALAASLARLVRVGEASLAAIWDLQDLRI